MWGQGWPSQVCHELRLHFYWPTFWLHCILPFTYRGGLRPPYRYGTKYNVARKLAKRNGAIIYAKIGLLDPPVQRPPFAKSDPFAPQHRCKGMLPRAVHHNPRTQYRSNRNEYRIDRIEKIQNATFEGIKPIVPGFFRIGIQSERDVRLNSFKSGIFHFCHF